MDLSLICNWDEKYGYDENETKFLKYFKQKKFVVCCYDSDNDVYDAYDDTYNDDTYLDTLGCFMEIAKNSKLTPLFINKYHFNNRTFCNINYAFLKFQIKCKRYYQNRMKYYKNPRNLITRQITGTFT